MSRYDAESSMKGQITIPVEVHSPLGLEPEGSVQFVTAETGKVGLIAKRRGSRHLKGLFGPLDAPFDAEMAIGETVARRTDPDRTEMNS